MRIKYSQSQKNKLKIAMKSEQKKHKIVQEKLDKPVAELQDDLNTKAMRDVNDELDLEALRKREEAFDKKTEDFKSHKIQKPEIILDMKPPKFYPYKSDDVR